MLIVDCSQDFGKTLTQMTLPHDDAPVKSLTAGMIGLWVAIHTVDPASAQDEVHFCRAMRCISAAYMPLCVVRLCFRLSRL